LLSDTVTSDEKEKVKKAIKQISNNSDGVDVIIASYFNKLDDKYDGSQEAIEFITLLN
jgi:hypothetical protein